MMPILHTPSWNTPLAPHDAQDKGATCLTPRGSMLRPEHPSVPWHWAFQLWAETPEWLKSFWPVPNRIKDEVE